MPARRIYLDHNASAPLLAEARAAMTDALETAGNPSSVHAEGRRARAIVESARASVAALVGADPEAVVFTSGASEAAATCLSPTWIRAGAEVTTANLAVGETDHPCLRNAGRLFAGSVTRLPVDAAGRVRGDALSALAFTADPDAMSILALTLANGETGVLTDMSLAGIAPIAAGGRLVVDAAQAAGRIRLDIKRLGCAALLLSGHKLGALPGIGAYILGDPDVRPLPLIAGGGQERGRRSGTEAVAAIASFGAAAEAARARLAAGAEAGLMTLRRHLEAQLAGMDGVSIVAVDAVRLPNTVMIAAAGLKAETAQIALDLAGFAVSAGSACASGKVGPSHVLTAMQAAGADIDASLGAIRVSFGYETTIGDIDAFVNAFADVLRRTAARRIDAKAA